MWSLNHVKVLGQRLGAAKRQKKSEKGAEPASTLSTGHQDRRGIRQGKKSMVKSRERTYKRGSVYNWRGKKHTTTRMQGPPGEKRGRILTPHRTRVIKGAKTIKKENSEEERRDDKKYLTASP